MTAASVRLLPYAVADGPHNMAADEVLLEAAVMAVASLRFYGWSEATLSLGYFQPEQIRNVDPRLAALPYVRRPTGGKTLVHHHELTYALALPAASPWQTPRPQPWLCRMHEIIAAALQELGVLTSAASCPGSGAGAALGAALLIPPKRPTEGLPAPPDADNLLCFHAHTPGDRLIGGAKVVGSAQRRQRGALLQHGAILFARSPYTPTLPGIRDLNPADVSTALVIESIAREWERQTGWPLRTADWTAAELRRTEALAAEKYALAAWNAKR
jgi:lipoate-protein ligase A